MSFDEEVDAAVEMLRSAERPAEEAEPDELAALQALAPKLEERIRSRRLTFAAPEDAEEELSIAVLHTDTDEILGHIYAEPGELVFESDLPDYFEDFVEEDPETFVARLYESLKGGLARYELDSAAEE